MPYSLDLFEINYGRAFSRPTFGVVANVGRILETLYATLSPEFAVKLADLSALPGSSVADVGARLKMFDGQVTIEVTAERLSINARGLRNAGDLEVVTRTAELSQQAVFSLFPDIEAGESTISTFGWMKRGEESDPSVKDILDKVKPPAIFAVSDGESVGHPIRMRLRNEVERFTCDFVCDEAFVIGTQLFFSATLKVEPTSPHNDILRIGQLGNALLRRWFEYLNIPVPKAQHSEAS